MYYYLLQRLSSLRASGHIRFFDVCVTMATRDGETFNMGMSCAFEIPPGVMRFVHEGKDLSQACNAAG